MSVGVLMWWISMGRGGGVEKMTGVLVDRGMSVKNEKMDSYYM